MIRQDVKSWNKGRADAICGLPSKCPKGLDALSYSSGYIEGKAQLEKYPLNSHARLHGEDAQCKLRPSSLIGALSK
jgi:hypothetical protein